MPCRPELTLKGSDNRADILAFVERRKYNYDFQRHVTFFKKVLGWPSQPVVCAVRW